MTARIALSIGCPSGIGPEVALVAASELASTASVLLVGDIGALERAAVGRSIAKERIVRIDSPSDPRSWSASDDGRIAVWQPTSSLGEHDFVPGEPSKAGGASQLAWIDAACDLVSAKAADALVTGPVSKSAIARSGAQGGEHFAGHTEHLQDRLGAEEVVMAFWSERLTTALVTTHLPLSRVPAAISPRAVATSIFWLSSLMNKLRPNARIAVAALNPHAGEGGLLGDEEKLAIAPGIELARKRLQNARIDTAVSEPIPAETAFRLAASGKFDAVCAMYHDQATIPMKLLGFGEAVNVSLGLPIVRTSVDHGTAYDRAAAFNADARGMMEAISLAIRLSD